MNHMLNSSSEDKERLRAEYVAAFDRQKQEIAALQSRLLATDKEGQDMDARSRALSEEIARLKGSVAASERQLANTTSDMAQQIKTYKVKLNEMLDQLEGKNS